MARSSRHITKNMERKDKMIYVFKNRIFKIEEWMVNVRVTSLSMMVKIAFMMNIYPYVTMDF